MSYRSLAVILALAVCAACKPAAQPSAKPGAGPQLRATVVTVRTTIQPGDRTYTHDVVIAGNLVRSTDEYDSWRVFDTKAGTITYVDDVAKTVRTEPLQEIIRRRRTATSGPLPSHYRRPQVARTGARRSILGVDAEQSVIQSGTYRRDLWFAKHPAIPERLFAMMYASDPPSSPLAPLISDVDQAIITEERFPLIDHSEVTYGNEKMVINRTVVKIEERDVPQGAVTPPRTYLDLTPKTE